MSVESTHLINKLVDCGLSEPHIGYANVLQDHAAYLWQLAAQYPGCTIDSYHDDVSGAFPQVIHHPDIARANVSIHSNKMSVTVALHFGGNYGPASWEPIARARFFLAGWMYKHTDHQEAINKKALNLFDLPDKEDLLDPCTVQPLLDDINKPVIDKESVVVPEFRMFVDDLLGAITCQEMDTRHFIASSIESVYVLIRYPGPIKNPTQPITMSWDKMANRAVGPIRDSLGVRFLNRHLEMTVED